MDASGSRVERALALVRRHILNRRMARALIIASPAVLTSVSSIGMGIAIDGRLSALSAEREAVAGDMGRLEQFAREFETKELQRASFLLGLAAANADERMRYTLDRLYRVSAAGSLRRIAASLYPDDWKGRLASYEDLIASDYRDAAVVQKMQDSENAMLQDARRTLTAQQARIDRLTATTSRLEARKNTIQSALNALMYVLTILIFFLQTAA